VNWLQHFLVQSIRRNLCTKVVCTTCGAREFRDGLRDALAEQLGQSKLESLTVDNLMEIGRALGDVQPDLTDGQLKLESLTVKIGRALGDVQPDLTDALYAQVNFEPAVRLVITDIWNVLGDEMAGRVIAPLLTDSWAGGLLIRMKLHHAQRVQARRLWSEYEAPEQVRARREAKRKLKQARHAERLARKMNPR